MTTPNKSEQDPVDVNAVTEDTFVAPPGPHHPQPAPMARIPVTVHPLKLTMFGRSDVGKTRAKDEDAFLISDLSDAPPIHDMASPVSFDVKERGVLIAVSDGMGGAQAGEVASELVLSSLWRGMSTVHASSATAALRTSIEDANQRVFDTAAAIGREGMGATLTAVLFYGPHIYIAEIGDSRAYLVRGKTIVQLTRDQTLVQKLIDSGAMTAEDADASDMKNVILQAMGIRTDIVVALTRVSVRHLDRVVVCSDGLSGSLNDAEMLDIVLSNRALDTSCAALVAAALTNGAEDDITVVIAEVAAGGALVESANLDATQPMAPLLDADVLSALPTTSEEPPQSL